MEIDSILNQINVRDNINSSCTNNVLSFVYETRKHT